MENILKNTFSSVLQRKRMELNLSQEKMAERCCMSLRQYNDLENGKRLSRLDTFFNIALVCDMDLNSMLTELIKEGYEVTDHE